jgi:phosphoribosylformimino-5-aminoimidazole carboxamide ribotide isomerase
MLIIPAIDLKDGQCVRLRQGDMDDSTVFSDDPVATAQRWVRRRLPAPAPGRPEWRLRRGTGQRRCGARHRRALSRTCRSRSVAVSAISRRSSTTWRPAYSYAIIGTQAVREPTFVAEACRAFPDRIIVGLDARDGRVATDGWAEVSALQATDLARRFAGDGVSAIVYTDISRDGMMQGVNIEATLDIAQAGNIPVIASGGITSMRDVRALVAAQEGGIIGAITGRAIYEGTLDYAEAQRYCDGTR